MASGRVPNTNITFFIYLNILLLFPRKLDYLIYSCVPFLDELSGKAERFELFVFMRGRDLPSG